MPDPMSPDPEVDVLAKAMDVVDPPIDGDESDEDRAEHRYYASDIVRALHAAGYRVVAAESESEPGFTVTQGGNSAFGPYRSIAAPTEEERQHE